MSNENEEKKQEQENTGVKQRWEGAGLSARNALCMAAICRVSCSFTAATRFEMASDWECE